MLLEIHYKNRDGQNTATLLPVEKLEQAKIVAETLIENCSDIFLVSIFVEGTKQIHLMDYHDGLRFYGEVI